MPSLTPSDRGFVADVRAFRSAERVRGRLTKRTLLVALCIISVIAVCASAPLRHDKAGASERSTGSTASPSYQFKVYAMNVTSMTRVDSGTTFAFRMSDLPFDLRSLHFGDFRADANRSHIYYAGSGILVDATGAFATITLRESSGKVISTVDYEGQDQIVFNGEVRSMTYPSTAVEYCGTDLMIQDWRNSAWSPGDGILIEHPGNVTALSASFFVMAIEPQGSLDIPELPSAMIGAVTTLIIAVVAIARRRSSADD